MREKMNSSGQKIVAQWFSFHKKQTITKIYNDHTKTKNVHVLFLPYIFYKRLLNTISMPTITWYTFTILLLLIFCYTFPTKKLKYLRKIRTKSNRNSADHSCLTDPISFFYEKIPAIILTFPASRHTADDCFFSKSYEASKQARKTYIFH